MKPEKLLVVQVAALGWKLIQKHGLSVEGLGAWAPAASVFPAVTCVAQASLRTGRPPNGHGMVANGRFFPELKKILFWEQSAELVQGERIWDRLRKRGGTVGMMFWQQSLVESVDLVLSPRPIHKHSGGMVQDCYTQPSDLYDRLCRDIGRSFNLMHYWGPLASGKSSAWIVDATSKVMADPSPTLLFTYLPHLDYDLQRLGPEHPRAGQALKDLEGYLQRLVSAARHAGYEVIVVGDYEIEPVTKPAVFPNRLLREAGLFETRTVKGMAYPDLFNYQAVAMVDHGVAHVYCRDESALKRTCEVFRKQPGIEQVLTWEKLAAVGLDHPNAGDVVLVAEPGAWFAYPWWVDGREAPDYASHVDIHNKPGFDPCELFFGWPPPGVSQNTSRVKGTHGRACEVAWASTVPLEPAVHSLLDLSRGISAWCGND